ncbi:MAG: phosphate ABC transporter permease PstA [Verrucomicrobiota bacterium]|jgi:phosphate transport system permease protein
MKSYQQNFFSGSVRKTSFLRLFRNRFLSGLCIALSLLTLVPLFSIVILVIRNGLPLLNLNLFTQLPPAPGLDGGGFGNAILGTLVMVGISLLLSVPLGVLSAIYINEYAPVSAMASAVRFVAKLLTGIPSIICGVFAFAAVVMTSHHFSAIAGGVALAILILPIILLTTEQALLGVSAAHREASFGVGATPFQTIWRIVLPDAMPAIMTGIMLAVSRAAGETAPVLFTALFSQNWIRSVLEPTASLSVLIYNFASLPYAYHIKLAWSASLVLVTLVTLTNILAQVIFSPKHR